jgi:transposase
MRKMQNYILRNKQIFIGLEDSKRTWKICVRADKRIVNETSMPAKYEVLHSYLFHHFPECQINVIYEAGFKGFGLCEKLINDGLQCIVTPPNKVTQEKDNRVKTDRIDARRLAVILENGDYKTCFIPDAELREDRQVSRTLIQVQKQLISTKNRIRKFLEFHGLDENLKPGKWFKSDYDNLKNFQLSDSLQFCINIYLEQLKDLQDLKIQIMKKLKEISKKERYSNIFQLFLSAPGIGWLTSIRLVLEWGDDLARFKTSKHFACYLGLTASEHSTGITVRKGRITKQSHAFVRAWLIQCAWAACRKDNVLLNKFNTVWRHSGNKKIAIVAVARKLAVRLRAIAISGIPYCVGLVE